MHDALGSPQPLRLFPEKLFYKIGEVSRVVGVESYVLRYWETEFPFLSPRKSKSGQRVYTKKDVDLILQIKKLLYEDKYTIDGVRRKLTGNVECGETTAVSGEITETATDKKGGPLVSDAASVLNTVKERLRKILSQHFGA
ncbi:MAG TPA: MerR family transcriptional regulator [Nitrospiraceae bacterium]|nr:MAG: hypothetical protein A2Z82_08670 [Nitrospirae bacterium GWA2_46_11]OGW25359.1 MAG: hypothetical protein A2X55_00645 [Nitrospirae bacterium GWB2_47_37]HAK87860.1 MerR family transcriptional regulator [Nitrospiraceae bacterium]HCZ11171.1 MerR family transcriptional regulator [Nitrospiraceae bacterium]